MGFLTFPPAWDISAFNVTVFMKGIPSSCTARRSRCELGLVKDGKLLLMFQAHLPCWRAVLGPEERVLSAHGRPHLYHLQRGGRIEAVPQAHLQGVGACGECQNHGASTCTPEHPVCAVPCLHPAYVLPAPCPRPPCTLPAPCSHPAFSRSSHSQASNRQDGLGQHMRSSRFM